MGSPMTPEDLHAEVSALWDAIRQLNHNQQALLVNIKRLSERLAIYEATRALDEMDEQTRLSH